MAGLENAFPKVYTTEEVIQEVKDSFSRQNLNMALSSGKISVFKPKQSSMQEAMEYVRQVRDSTLSKADISVLALALELRPCLVLTDDFSLQNVLRLMGIEYKSVKVKGSVNDVKEFQYICEGCGKIYKHKVPECEICGSTVVKRSKKG
ncbi:NOB1 family endonuclease [Sulfuracidifex tepidarius]|uniref:NOB1 family endonuclease n=1 Tax=Sulfuracidifex tepidarius TaxID=1294262 RepID=UPI0006D1F207|nr:hypothetical protein [Sulfuracidifex tepidarius]